MEKIKCGIYTRVSTDLQAEKEFNSCEAQSERMKAYVKSQENLEIYKIYEDAGFTGANTDRPALKAMLADIAEGKIKQVLTYKVDRLTRSPKDFYTLIEYLESFGVSFISITEHFDTSSPSGRLLRNIMLTFAQFEREMTSERTKDKMAQRAKKGMWNGGIPPYGYKNIDKKAVVNEAEAKVVKDIFRIFLATQSLAETQRQINKRYKNRQGGTFAKTVIDYILRNHFYAGKINHKGTIYQGLHQPIISEIDFLKAQTLMRKRENLKTRIKREFPLIGLIRCSHCNSIMTPSYTQNRKRNGKGSRYTYYYRCTKTTRFEWGSCKIKSVNAEKIEAFVIQELRKISQDKKAIKLLVRKANENEEEKVKLLKQKEKELMAELNKTEKSLQNIIKAITEGANSFSAIKTKLKELEDRKKLLEDELQNLRIRIAKEGSEKYDARIVLETLQGFATKVENASGEEQKHAFQSTIKNLTIGEDKIEANLFYIPQKMCSKIHSNWLHRLNNYQTIKIILPSLLNTKKLLTIKS